MSALSLENERQIQPWDLSIEQLSTLKKQHEDEISELQSQLQALNAAKGRFNNSKTCIDEIAKTNINDKLLVPLNSSLYCSGTIYDNESVIVELGTGYYAEKQIPAAKDLIDRKLQLVQKSIESIEQVGVGKAKNLETLTNIMNYKIQELEKK